MKLGKFEIESSKLLGIGVTVLGVAGTLLANVVDSNNRKEMKADLKNEILEELLKKEN